MKRIIWALLAMVFLAGCMGNVQMHSFSPYITSDGQEKWRMAVNGFDEVTIQALLESEIGKYHVCPNGWEILSRAPALSFELIEGQCKKPKEVL